MSSRPLLEAAFWLFGSATTVFALYSGGGIVVPFLLAPGRLRLRVAKARPSASTRDLAGRGDAGDGGPARTGARPFATASEIAGSGVARDGGPTSTGARVSLSGIDPTAIAVSSFGIGIFPAIFAPFGSWGAWVGVVVGAVLCGFGCRLRVHATPARTTVVRTVLFVVPWRWRSYASPPSAFVDGWGDFSDPESLQLAFDGEEEPLELGWGGDPGPSCDALAARINEAMASLQHPR